MCTASTAKRARRKAKLNRRYQPMGKDIAAKPMGKSPVAKPARRKK